MRENLETRDKWHAAWKDRFTRYLRSEEQVFDPIWEDVATRTAGVRAACLLNVRLERLSLADWSELLLLALQDQLPESQDYAPLWMAVPALDQLGISNGIAGLRNVTTTNYWTNMYKNRQDWKSDFKVINNWFEEQVIEIPSVEPSAIGIVLSRPGSSITKGWRKSFRFGVVVVGKDILDKFNKTLNLLVGVIFRDLGTTLILDEISTQTNGVSGIDDSLPQLERSLPSVSIASSTLSEIPKDHPVVVNPRGLDDAMKEALRIIEQRNSEAK